MTGGSGLLGGELKSYNPDIHAPSSKEMNILDQRTCVSLISSYMPDTLIHAAAYTAVDESEKVPVRAREVNVRGTLNLVNICEGLNIRLVYISTDYVFDGKSGGYKADDPINPINIYSMTKAAAELAVRTMKNSLVIRTSFCPKKFPHAKAFTDQYSSKDYVDIIAPMIYGKVVSDELGVTHIGTERKSIYDLARKRTPEVGKLSINEVEFNPPPDISFKNE